MDSQFIENVLKELKVNSRGQLRGQSRVIDKIHSQHLRDMYENEKKLSGATEVFKWLQGLKGDFQRRKDGDGPFWWRTPLRLKLRTLNLDIKL
jgi:hypothetical protein